MKSQSQKSFDLTNNISFTASWPNDTPPSQPNLFSAFAKPFLYSVLPPVGFVAFTSKMLAQQAFYRSVLPTAGQCDPLFLEYLDLHREMLFEGYRCERIVIALPDGTPIDTLYFPGERTDRAILACQGNASFAETSAFAEESEGICKIDFLMQTGASVLLFNPTEVGHSHGKASPETLALSVYSAYEYLIHEKKIKPHNILLYGTSLGGCYGNLGAALIQKKYPEEKIHVVNNRSFSTLSSVAKAVLKNPLTARFLKRFIPRMGMEMNSKEAFDTLKGEKLLIYHRFDTTIPHEASLYTAVLKNPIGTVMAFELRDAKWDEKCNYHRRSYTLAEEKILIELFKNILNLPCDPALFTNHIEIVKNALNQ